MPARGRVGGRDTVGILPANSVDGRYRERRRRALKGLYGGIVTLGIARGLELCRVLGINSGSSAPILHGRECPGVPVTSRECPIAVDKKK